VPGNSLRQSTPWKSTQNNQVGKEFTIKVNDVESGKSATVTEKIIIL